MSPTALLSPGDASFRLPKHPGSAAAAVLWEGPRGGPPHNTRLLETFVVLEQLLHRQEKSLQHMGLPSQGGV